MSADAAAISLSGRRLRAIEPSVVALTGLLLIVAVGKSLFRRDAPLWLDEVWTGMIASQSSLGGLIRQCYLDVGAPLSYVVAWLWVPLSGLSNSALRFPSVVFACAAPLAALLPARLAPRSVRYIWAALLACWLPSIPLAAEARCYCLLLFVATINAAAYAAVLKAPTTRTALAWMAASCLLVLTHYVALALVGCQGLVYLLVHRGRAIRTWPALIAFVPAALSLAAHAALLSSFIAAGGAQASPMNAGEALSNVEFLLGGSVASVVVVVWAAMSLLLLRVRKRRDRLAEDRADDRLWIVPAVSVGAVALCLGISMLRPFVAYRYLTPMVPGVLLGVAILAQRLAPAWRLCGAALVAVEFGLVIGVLCGAVQTRPRLSFEAASDALMKVDARQVTFLVDLPVAARGDPDAFTQVGGFFFRRAGSPARVQALILQPGQDPNLILAPLANRRGAGILWLYDELPNGPAVRFPPRLEQLDSRWRCRDFGNADQHVLACANGGAI
jgi:hypothetical protein